jgi:predicted RNase H-like HicB family nuclease
MKILTIVGARPQFIKAAMVSRAIIAHKQPVTCHSSPAPSFTPSLIAHMESTILKRGNSMIVKYIDRAMSKAVYDKLDDGSFSGKIPQCPGVIAFGETLYQCEQELKASLEGWLIVKLRHGDKLPVICNISLNKRKPSVHGEAVIHG